MDRRIIFQTVITSQLPLPHDIRWVWNILTKILWWAHLIGHFQIKNKQTLRQLDNAAESDEQFPQIPLSHNLCAGLLPF